MQIVDRRQITFDGNAVRAALKHANKVAERLDLPRKSPELVRMAPEVGVIELIYAGVGGFDTQTTSKFRLTREQIAAVLIEECIRSRIPMPRSSKKSIILDRDGVILSFVKVVDIAD